MQVTFAFCMGEMCDSVQSCVEHISHLVHLVEVSGGIQSVASNASLNKRNPRRGRNRLSVLHCPFCRWEKTKNGNPRSTQPPVDKVTRRQPSLSVQRGAETIRNNRRPPGSSLLPSGTHLYCELPTSLTQVSPVEHPKRGTPELPSFDVPVSSDSSPQIRVQDDLSLL